MKLTLADKFIAWLTLFCGLTLSAVAIYYSVAGLVSIFAAAVVPIIIMGTVLEVSKLVATVWLKQNWFIAPKAIKAYLLAAIFLLMFITSMGIFGYLSKAHMDQGLVSGDVLSKISVYDEKIKIAKENIDANRRSLKQMDEAVDQTMGSSTTEQGADKAVQVRRSQARERTRLLSDIEAEQKKITELNEARAPIAAEVRKVEAEVGPIKYIAALLYGDNPDANLLEAAVRWVIIMIVIVFDPLAVILLLASQYSFAWFRQQPIEPIKENITDKTEQFLTVTDTVEFVPAEKKEIEQVYLSRKGNYKVPGVSFPPQVYRPEEPPKKVEPIVETITAQEAFQTLPKSWPPAASPITNEEIDQLLDDDLKSEKQQWKASNPENTIKRQEKLKELGIIESLPWEEPIEPKKKYMIKSDQEQIVKTKK